jgi:hypothetical protein
MPVSRRALVFIVAALAVSALVAWVAAGVVREMRWVYVTDMDGLRAEGVVYAEDLQVFLVATGDPPTALSALSPHRSDLGERVLYCRSNSLFQGDHGERFDRRGILYGGPSSRGLDRVTVRVVGGEIYVDPDDVSPGQPGGQLLARPPTGT